MLNYIIIFKNLIDYNNPINYKSLANYAYFMKQKVAIEVMIDLIIREFIIYINAIRLII